MAKLNVDQTKATFGPEWLSSFSSGHLSLEDDLSSQYNNTKNSQRNFYPMTKKVPLRFTRSKSTPLLPVEEQERIEGTLLKEKKKEDVGGVGVFAMIKERNSFDRNFPTLNTIKPRNINSVGNTPTINGNTSSLQSISASPTNSNKIETSSAWKISQSKSNPLTIPNSPPNGTSTSPSTRDGVESEMQLASLIVPNVQPPKVLTKNRIELLTKKGPNKKKFESLRKATSEPNLPIPPAYQENYAKLMAAARKGAPDPKYIAPKPLEKKTGTVVLNRNEFFKGIVRNASTPPLEEPVKGQHRRVFSDDRAELIERNLVSPFGEDNHVTTEERTPSGSSSNANTETRLNDFDINFKDSILFNNNSINHSRSPSPKLVSVEDEEKFLRNLGWLPEEEIHVPELTQEEILDWEARKK